jgi:phosphosulfolactate synthase
MTRPSFLHLPPRPDKPRSTGQTHVIDGGVSALSMEGVLRGGAEYIDVWKFGWGTAYVDPTVTDKLALLRRHGVLGCLGGTFMEVAWAQGKANEYLAWAHDIGFEAVEVSRGIAAMSVADKHALIARAARTFTVFSEVGRKDSDEDLSLRQWSEEVAGDCDAGAQWVIAEGRESGTVGLYRSDGTVRSDVVEAILQGADRATVFFDAPRKSQQAWFVHEFGPDVNLANIAADSVISLETLRLGLRADTFGLSQQWSPILH